MEESGSQPPTLLDKASGAGHAPPEPAPPEHEARRWGGLGGGVVYRFPKRAKAQHAGDEGMVF